MTITDYQTIIKQTKVYPNSAHHFGPAYCYMGLLGEFHELMNAVSSGDSKLSIMSEVSDVYWYITALCLEFDLSYEYVMTIDKDYQFKDLSILALAEPLKKYYRDGKQIDRSLFEETLKHLAFSLNLIAKSNGFSQSEVLQYNYNKLMKRKETNQINGDGSFRENQ